MKGAGGGATVGLLEALEPSVENGPLIANGPLIPSKLPNGLKRLEDGVVGGRLLPELHGGDSLLLL